jgi:hypothetical protein
MKMQGKESTFEIQTSLFFREASLINIDPGGGINYVSSFI